VEAAAFAGRESGKAQFSLQRQNERLSGFWEVVGDEKRKTLTTPPGQRASEQGANSVADREGIFRWLNLLNGERTTKMLLEALRENLHVLRGSDERHQGVDGDRVSRAYQCRRSLSRVDGVIEAELSGCDTNERLIWSILDDYDSFEIAEEGIEIVRMRDK